MSHGVAGIISKKVFIKSFCKSQSRKIRQLFVSCYQHKEQVVLELAFAKQLYKQFLCDKFGDDRTEDASDGELEGFRVGVEPPHLSGSGEHTYVRDM